MSARARAEAYLRRRGWPGAELTELQGDASTRTYFRARLHGRSEVLLVEPEASGEPSRAFVSIARFLDQLGFAPPRLLDQAPDLGLIALEDLGSVSLRRALEAAPTPGARRALFGAALDLVARLQTEGTARLGPEVHAFHVRFDAAVFARELRLFHERCLLEHLGVALGADDLRGLEAAYAWLSAALAARSSVLTHRDYHIDNLFVVAGRLRPIDFQDARWGPPAYDPASLLSDRDVHRFVGAADTAALLDDFVAARKLEPEDFAREHALAVTQRSLKACGTFADQFLRRGRAGYLAYIGPSLARAAGAAGRFPELAPLVRVLAPAA